MIRASPATMDSDSLTSEVQLNWRRKQIGRPEKENRAMGSPTLESNIDILKYRHIRTAGLAEIVCGANVKPRLLESGGCCKEAET